MATASDTRRFAKFTLLMRLASDSYGVITGPFPGRRNDNI